MSILLRNKIDASQEDYFNDLYNMFGGVPANHQAAINMRMEFVSRYILNNRISDYKTPVEKDWAYIVRREYRYDVNLRAMLDAFALADLACIARMYMVKKFIIWPFVPVFTATYLYRQRSLFVFH